MDGKKNNKITIFSAIGVAVVVITVVLFNFLIIPMQNYSRGEEAFLAGDYESAYTYFSKASAYKDASSRKVESQKGIHYINGSLALDEHRFEDAANEFQLAEGFQDAQYKFENIDKYEMYYIAQTNVDEEDYASAQILYNSLGDFLDSSDKYAEVTYLLAEQYYDKGKMFDAATNYGCINPYEDSEDKLLSCAVSLYDSKQYDDAADVYGMLGDTDYENYCDAMAEYQKKDYFDARYLFSQTNGLLDSADMELYCYYLAASECCKDGDFELAMQTYELLPGDYEVDGITVQNRIDAINGYSNIIAVCGNYNSYENLMKSEYSGYYWYIEDDPYYGGLKINCYLNDDLTLTLNGTANYYMYTSFSTIGSLLSYKNFTCNFSYTFNPGDSMVSKFEGNNGETITYSNGTFNLKRTETETATIYSSYVYSADYTYEPATY